MTDDKQILEETAGGEEAILEEPRLIIEGSPAKHYVTSSGAYIGAFADQLSPPDGGIEVDDAPEYFDQKWGFPGWSESLAKSAWVENSWRESELGFISEQLLMLEDEDPSALPGTPSQWRAHRVEVRAWKEGNPNFPDIDKRPARPRGE